MYSVGEIGRLLRSNGYTVYDLTQRLWTTKGTCISYSMVCCYVRVSDINYGKPEVWKDILECLDEMGVIWHR